MITPIFPGIPYPCALAFSLFGSASLFRGPNLSTANHTFTFSSQMSSNFKHRPQHVACPYFSIPPPPPRKSNILCVLVLDFPKRWVSVHVPPNPTKASLRPWGDASLAIEASIQTVPGAASLGPPGPPPTARSRASRWWMTGCLASLRPFFFFSKWEKWKPQREKHIVC